MKEAGNTTGRGGARTPYRLENLEEGEI